MRSVMRVYLRRTVLQSGVDIVLKLLIQVPGLAFHV